MMLLRLVVVATLVSSVAALGHIPIRSAAVRVLAAVDPIPTPDQYTHWEEKNYTQLIDHFNFNVNCELGSQTTYTQRYLLNTTYWKRSGGVDGPIFLYAGNEGDIELFAQNSGFMWDIAPQFGALLIFPEHRYYGKSYPFPDQKANVASLQYLTAEQALADYAVMIQDLKHQWNTTAPVIVFGGSYGGMLAAWMRIKYPHVVAGAIAASAPIWQFTDLVDPGMFNFIVTRTFHNANSYCDSGIFKSWSIIRQRLTTPEGRKSLKQIFHLCDDVMDTDGDQLVNWIAGNLNSLAMGDYPYPSTFLGPMPANPVNYACKEFKFNQTDDELLQALYHVQHTAIDYTNSSTCYSLNVTGPPTLAADNGWNYQSCNEMVMPIGQYGRNGSSLFQNDMFEYAPWNLTQQIASCESQFVGVTPQPDWIATNWPATLAELNQTSNIVFSNGNLDPWSGGGVLQNVSDTVVAYHIEGGAHHLDLRGANPQDPLSVKWVRAAEVEHIRTWINKANAIPKSMRSKRLLRGTGINGAGNPNTVCPSASSSGLATKWVAVISVLVTLALVGAALFIKQRWFDPKPTPVVHGDYEAVNH